MAQKGGDKYTPLFYLRNRVDDTVEASKKDRYGRDIGKALVDGVDVNLEQVRRGLAWHYKAYQREQSTEDRATYVAAEEAARRLRLGLCQDAQPVPPWEYRRN